MSFIVNTSLGGYLYGGSGIVYVVAPRRHVHRHVRHVFVQPRPAVRIHRQVDCCCFCHSTGHLGRHCPLYLNR
jgi:hypothetical protein